LDVTVRCDFRRPLEAVQEDRAFSETARAAGIVVPTGPWLDGHIRGIATAVRRTIPGAPLSELRPNGASVPFRLGRILGTLHGIAAPAPLRAFFYASLFDLGHARWREFDDLAAAFGDVPSLLPLLREGRARVHGVPRPSAGALRSPTGVTHGDFTPPNVLLDGRQLIVIDWEKACVGPVLADVAQAIYYLSALFGPSGPDVAAAFVAGYRQRRAVGAAALARWLGCYPAFIFLGDAVSAVRSRHGERAAAGADWVSYLIDVSAPRFRGFLDIEGDVLRAVA
jgi:Ser/Thr protein kinase RdoA (MazF antagonist)